MSQRISGKNIDITIGDLSIHVEKATLSIEDNTEVAQDNGVPNGWVSGDAKAEGDLELDALAISLLSQAAKNAGSFRELPEFDILFYAKTGDSEEMKVEAFGCKVKLESLLDIDRKGGEKHISKLKYMVTSPDFVRINGVPYLSTSDTDGLVGG
ncbi:phage protein [Desulfocurvibacter africanus]|uniref:phage protein n=1 Tax=Desulfocurvibacter africanus TaxID=873 RepID=UPI00040A44A0|nr:phage protein [Desulfocurvibacter africanus]